METADQARPLPSGLTKAETRVTLRSFVWYSSFRGVFDTVCSRTTFIFVAFALSLGMPRERMGLFATLFSVASIFQIAGITFTSRVKDRKRFILTLSLAEPLVMTAGVFVVLFLAPGMRLYVLAVAIFIAAASYQLTMPLMDEWAASAIPVELRGRYLGRRLQIHSLVVIVTTLVMGMAGERVDKGDSLGLAFILAAGSLFGILALLPLRKATLPTLSASSHVHWADLLNAFRHKPFVRFLAMNNGVNAPFFLVSAYQQVYNLEILHLSKTTIASISTCYLLTRVLFFPWMGRLVSRHGHRRMLFLMCPLFAVLFALQAASSAERVWPVFLGWTIAGVADACWGVANQNALYEAVPDAPARPAYFALFNLVSFTCFALGSLLAIPLLESLRGFEFRLGPIVLGQFQFCYAVCAVLAFIGAFSTLLLVDSRSNSKRE